MSISAAQSVTFFTEISETQFVWTIEDAGGIPTSTSTEGTSMPFWSQDSRAQRVIDTVPAYAFFRPRRIALADFVAKWLPGLRSDRLLVGINWSGNRATGYDMLPDDVLKAIGARAIAPRR